MLNRESNLGTVSENRIDRLTRELQVLTDVAKTLTAWNDLDQILSAIMKQISATLEIAEIGAIMLWDQSVGVFRAQASFGYDAEIVKSISLCKGEGIPGKVFDEGRARLISSAEEIAYAMQDLRLANRTILARSLGTEYLPLCSLAVPIVVRNEKLGILILEILHGSEVFALEDLRFVQLLADLIGLAIDRARLDARADAVRVAQEAERHRFELMATLSHELRLPLTAIKGYATTLTLEEVEWSEEKQQKFLHLIEQECLNMEGLLTNILDSSILRIEQLSLDLQPVRLSHIAREIAAELNHRTERHVLIVDFPMDCPSIIADPKWIKQVFRNILDNAIKYSPDGRLILVHGENRQSDILVSISDQGIGISPEDLILLFEKFFRARSQTGLQIPGTGLGLPVARAIVEAHGGRIWAESKLGQGTTLSFSLPISGPALVAEKQ